VKFAQVIGRSEFDPNRVYLSEEKLSDDLKKPLVFRLSADGRQLKGIETTIASCQGSFNLKME
jgi:hypothetical protein